MYGHGGDGDDGDNDISHENNRGVGGTNGMPGSSHLIDNS